MKTKEFKLDTPKEGFLNITRSVRETIKESGVQSGICVVYCAHTTAGITCLLYTSPSPRDRG